MSRLYPLVLALAALPACVHFPNHTRLVTRAGAPSPILIRDARVFRATSTEAEEHLDVLIADGRIQSVGPTGAAPPAGARVIDGQGKTLLPGFVDLHAHLTYTAAPPWYLTLPKPTHNAEAHVYSGVTTILDLGGDIDDILDVQRRIADGRLVGPRIYFAGPHLTAPGGYPLNMIKQVYGSLAAANLGGSHVRGIASVAEMEKTIDRLHERGARFVKLIVATIPPTATGAPHLDETLIRAAVARAHGHGMKVAAHIDTLEDARTCARSGVDLLAHDVVDSAVSEADAKELAASGIHMEPTLVGWERWDELGAGHYVGSAIERQTEPPELMAQFSDEKLRAEMHVWSDGPFRSWGVELARHKGDRVTNLQRLHAAGMPIHVGTDAMGSIAAFAGAYHDELKFLVEAGLPPGEVLRQATAGAAAFLDDKATFGVIEPGRAADLVLVRGNPLADITATREIETVIVGGALVERTPVPGP
jgi:imidazolonepropionase-like amidohydrolase